MLGWLSLQNAILRHAAALLATMFFLRSLAVLPALDALKHCEYKGTRSPVVVPDVNGGAPSGPAGVTLLFALASLLCTIQLVVMSSDLIGSSYLLLQVLPYVTPGATVFSNASLAVDVAGILGFVAPPPSAEKAGLIRIPLGWGGWGYWG